MTEGMLDQAPSLRVDLARMEYDIDQIVKGAIVRRDDSDIVEMALSIRNVMAVRGLMLAKLLHEWKKNAPTFGIQTDDWIDHVVSSTGLSAQTVYKYTDMWGAIFCNGDVPPTLLPTLAAKPMQALLLLTAAVKEGQLTDQDWDEIEDAPDPATIRDVVRRARGKSTSSETAVIISVDRNGTITVRRGDEFDTVGYLNLEPETALAEVALERIIRETRIVRE